ncbi:unnamed protein product [Zymoseptoria tritici ST99CH_1A5]|uniref:L-serine ammonia-lyase n=4 Tax=Zymoseptoria tritici TaxID=1047171 RepID=F9X1F6_ZYMTI|nr:uncharacterized protein MYCGRDRAFT_53956 [Zymoseptoria tritici IPO323]SMQ46523.1 unnamed protein product [Zymoseptoria tritici ST99CH_3D7]SMR42874.1 unnamed protein product [Zymoseptoria tritici ST99CH_1E4]SMR45044.1 unnamed protein product [Zymoseptoria tritici ST99CH_3D1]SMY20209.1 unnamed protein product [Zymoseptoria tritici ST99CH_1A5]EGP92061.1 hypothetical protein MYCGRDRAFT_53956 [Zymoseptoria tritici IPO323]
MSKQPWIETPLIWSKGLSRICGCNIYLKLENTQPSGSFKSRGMGAFVKAHLPDDGANGTGDSRTTTHFFCSSGGNAGLGCVSAAVTFICPATIVVPDSTSAYMIDKLKKAGAHEVIQTGASWYEADQYLRKELLPAARAGGQHAVYVPPFDDPAIWAGNSTMVDEIVQQLSTVDDHYPSATRESGTESVTLPDAIICSVGGGGLLNGIMQGLERHSAWKGETGPMVLAVETVGADALSQSVEKGELVTLPKITSIATTLGARRVSEQTFTYAMDRTRVKCAVLTDKETVEACKRFADDERMLVEPACAVSLAVLYTGKLHEYIPGLQPESRVVVVVCGGSGLSLQILNQYIKDFLD